MKKNKEKNYRSICENSCILFMVKIFEIFVNKTNDKK